MAARDDVESAVADTVADIKAQLLQTASFKQTGKRQSLLLLYEGGRMLLDGKLCATLGLMNGTEVVIEKNLLNDKDCARGDDASSAQGNVQCLTW